MLPRNYHSGLNFTT